MNIFVCKNCGNDFEKDCVYYKLKEKMVFTDSSEALQAIQEDFKNTSVHECTGTDMKRLQ